MAAMGREHKRGILCHGELGSVGVIVLVAGLSASTHLRSLSLNSRFFELFVVVRVDLN